MGSKSLQIPDSEKKPLSALMRLPTSTFEQLYEALSNIPPRLRSRDLWSKVAGAVDLPDADLRRVVDLIVSLYSVREYEGLSVDAFVHQLCEAAKTSGDEELTPAEGGWEAFEKRFAKILSLEKSLGITSKALLVAYQFPRHFHSARILTDARPVFTSDASQEPAAFVINHALRVDIHEEGTDREWFVALNSADLSELKQMIERAIAKEESLRTALKRTGAAVLEWEE